ncbi:MAG: anaerobic sulfatase maturase [Deltaproteobacteria bacterium]|nr:anaerobic sulfatase maturase [Deltaproteobacteria bacterium]MBW2053743.1 anaerobic sulfatase maturase [Deltaproteobacteria bacterium]MBW2140758.1 anaerobic sulfatase maturase [Deltaproteobacteria bacterium]
MKNFSLLIKPASADCNLRCDYCFYLDHAALYPQTKVHRMSDQVLEKMIASYMATEQEQYAFGWQGGEPALMGLEFFKRVTDLQQKHGRRGSMVANGFQTNGTLIHDKFARHLSEYNFLVGVSLDGPPEIHDHYRRNRGGKASHADVMRGIKCLKTNKVDFNILVLVNNLNVKKPAEVYNYLCQNGFFYHQYIPCVEFDEAGKPLPFTVSGEEWGDFLCSIFDEWIKSDITKVSIRLFDSILAYLVEDQRIICHMGTSCCQYYVVEYNGDIYPCDFFVEQDLKLGSVLTNAWDELHHANKYLDFGARKSDWNQACQECLYLELCSGDCLKHRLYHEVDPSTLSWLCSGWKKFYAHSLPAFKQIAERLKMERRQASMGPPRPIPPPEFKNIGRNDPCPCGSGKKYKKCCMNRQTSQP